MERTRINSGRKIGDAGKGSGRLLLVLWLFPVVMPLLSPGISMAGTAFRGGQSQGRFWLEAGYQRETEAYERKRDTEYDEGRVLDVVGVKAGMTVGEVGAGNGYFTLKLADRVGPSGRIYANDIIGSALEELKDRAKQRHLSNIITILGTETDPRLPSGQLDMVFLVRAFHDLSEPIPIMDKIAASLRPGGKVVVVEVEYEVADVKLSRPQTRRQYVDLLAKTFFKVERIDKSLPNPRSIVLVLAPK